MEVLQVQPDTYAGVDDFVDSFFRKTPTDLTYQNTRYQTYLPVNAIAGTGVSQINFFIQKWAGPILVDINNALLAVKLGLTKSDGKTKVPDESVVAPINNILHSMFSEIRIYYNNTLMTPNGLNYGYKKYIETLVSYNTDNKTGALQAAGYYEDSRGKYNLIGRGNDGFAERLSRFATWEQVTVETKKKWVAKDYKSDWFIGRWGTDLTQPIINGIDVRIEMVLQKAKFFLMTGEDEEYQYRIDDIKLMVPIKTLTLPVMERIEQRLKTTDIIQAFRRVEITPFTIHKDTKNFLSEQLFPSQLLIPARCIMVLVPETSYLGAYDANPYEFKCKFGEANLTELVLTLNGERIDGMTIGAPSRTMDFVQMYHYLDQLNSGYSSGIELDDYKTG